jgi:sarcosine oxidase gamma subunit
MSRNEPPPTPSADPNSARRAAEQDEQARFNAACARRGPVPLQTATGLRLVWRVTPDWWYVCGPDQLTASSLPGRNDEAWAALMAWVGEPRHPLLDPRFRSHNGGRRP